MWGVTVVGSAVSRYVRFPGEEDIYVTDDGGEGAGGGFEPEDVPGFRTE